jgi:hypothetical protein
MMFIWNIFHYDKYFKRYTWNTHRNASIVLADVNENWNIPKNSKDFNIKYYDNQ